MNYCSNCGKKVNENQDVCLNCGVNLKKDKKIELQLSDSKVTINNAKVDGYALQTGKKTIGEIAELENRFAVVENGEVKAFFKNLEQAIESTIENYNLNR